MQGTKAGGGAIRKLASSMPPGKLRPKVRGERTGAQGNQMSPGGLGGVSEGGFAASGGVDAGAGGGAGPPPQPTRESICLEILTSGYVQSYVDFFYLTHRPDPNPDLSTTDGSIPEIAVSVPDMLFLRDQLTRAESARRIGERHRSQG